MSKSKLIRSHYERVKAANRIIDGTDKYRSFKISRIEREAFVEFFLLEDICYLYKMWLEKMRNYVPCDTEDQTEQIALERNIKKFQAIISLFDAAIELARVAIDRANYSAVWKAIPEGALMVAAEEINRLPELRELAVEMLRRLFQAVESDSIVGYDNCDVCAETIEKIIGDAEAAIPDKE